MYTILVIAPVHTTVEFPVAAVAVTSKVHAPLSACIKHAISKTLLVNGAYSQEGGVNDLCRDHNAGEKERR